ncbi:hypothetical protein [Absidia glauca]|uniref:Myb-like domain-containing protein n=1 Tax=Absidia glauca TaxID=4829 RepID=A0A168L7D9_ABSGL|nr:hypothetical protein [Absidia glauca]
MFSSSLSFFSHVKNGRANPSFLVNRFYIYTPQRPSLTLGIKNVFRTLHSSDDSVKIDPTQQSAQGPLRPNNSMQRRGTRLNSAKYSRRIWTEEEDELLRSLFETQGPRYSFIASQFPERTVATVYNRCKLLSLNNKGALNYGPWGKDELEALRKLTDGMTNESHIPWEEIQRRLPQSRPLSLIKQTWYHSINPKWNHGLWAAEETERLKRLIDNLGTNDWCTISDLHGTRSPRQCLEKYRYQMAPRQKGRFTPAEDNAILMAVEKYGDKDFKIIKEVLQSERTPRQISQHYRYALDPAYNRAPWSEMEKDTLYRLILKHGNDMIKIREIMGGNRHPKDMYNKYKLYERQLREEKADDPAHNKDSETIKPST